MPKASRRYTSLSSVGRAPDCSRKKTQPSVKADIRGPPVQVRERGPNSIVDNSSSGSNDERRFFQNVYYDVAAWASGTTGG